MFTTSRGVSENNSWKEEDNNLASNLESRGDPQSSNHKRQVNKDIERRHHLFRITTTLRIIRRSVR